MKRRVAITGLGLVSCLGHDEATVLAALESGRSGLRAVPEWGERGLRSRVAGLIEPVDDKLQAARLPKKLIPAMSEAALYCSLAARDAVANAGLTTAELGDRRTGCFVGSGIGSIDAVRRAADLYFAGHGRKIDPFTVLRAMASSASAAVAAVLGVGGRSYSLSSACATSAHNIGHAYELIRDGLVDRAIAGGGEEINELITAGFQSLRMALSTHFNDAPERASRPFDRQRDGFVISGGAGIVVLEELTAARRRGAAIRAEIAGFGANSDAYDLVLPQADGGAAAECMQQALADAAVDPADIDYLNAHGTSTVAGDLAEARAIRRVFGEHPPPISSTKSMTGHTIGAAGALELIFCVGMLERGFLAPSINIDDLDPDFADLPILFETLDRQPAIVISNNFGFGGTNASLVIRKSDG